MSDDTFRKSIETIAAFEYRNDTALAEFIRQIDHNPRHGSETGRRDVEAAKKILSHPIEAGADQDEIRFKFASRRHELIFESIEKLRVSRANRHRYIQFRPCGFSCAGF